MPEPLQMESWQRELVEWMTTDNQYRQVVLNMPPHSCRLRAMMPVRELAWMRAALGESIVWYDVPTESEARASFESYKEQHLNG